MVLEVRSVSGAHRHLLSERSQHPQGRTVSSGVPVLELAPDSAARSPKHRSDITLRVPSDTELNAAAAVVGSVLGNPVMVLMALQSELRTRGQELHAHDVHHSDQQSKRAEAFQLEQLAKAAKAADKAARKAPPWVKKLIGAILTAVGTVASIAGGAGLALVAVGAALVIGAKLVEKVLACLASKGLISERAAMIVSTVVKMVAAVAAAVTGQVSGLANGVAQAATAAVEVAKSTAEIIKSAQQIVQAATDIAFAGVDAHSHIRSFQSTKANIAAESWGMEAKEKMENVEFTIESLKDLEKHFGRITKVATDALVVQARSAMFSAEQAV